MAKLVDGFKDGRPELGRRTFLVPENHSEVLALLYHEQTGIVGGLPVGPVTTDPFGGTFFLRLEFHRDGLSDLAAGLSSTICVRRSLFILTSFRPIVSRAHPRRTNGFTN